jgi:tRNA-specific 2-thiouridylase
MPANVLVAMSGGVDSTVAAWLLQQQGYDCIGATMLLYNEANDGRVEDARAVAAKLNIPFHVFDLRAEFQAEVISRFVTAYQAGATPNPCIECNRRMKFGRLMDLGTSLGCEFIASGHYARIEKTGDRYLLRKGADLSKDQSYVLAFLTQSQLARIKLPLGAMTKAEIRQLAHQQGFVNSAKKESQDICFVPDGDYAKIIKEQSSLPDQPGDFVDLHGRLLGKHQGLIHYTIGQRRGLGLAMPEPVYVVAKQPHNNTVIIGSEQDLYTKQLDADDFNWIAYDQPPQELRVKAKIRYGQTEQWATVHPNGADAIHLTFDEPQRAIARGQAVVLYEGDFVVGGGTIQ